MVFLYFLEIIVQIMVLFVLISQIVLPAFLGGQYFPLFRRKDLSHQAAEAEENYAQALELKKIENLRKRTELIKSSTKRKVPNDDANKSS